MNKALKNNLSSDEVLLLESLEDKEGELCSSIMCHYLNSYKVSEICRALRLSRFKVKKLLSKGIAFFKNVLERERIYLKSKKGRRKFVWRRNR